MNTSITDWRSAVKACALKARTPFYVFRSASINNNASALRRAFNIPGRRVDFFYSVKTNPAANVVSHLVRADFGLLASSGGDLSAALRSGAKRLIFDAPCKNRNQIRAAAHHSNAIVVSENMSDLRTVLSTRSSADHANLGLRILVPESVCGHRSRFGLELDGLLRADCVAGLRQTPFAERGISLHFHVGGKPVTSAQFGRLGAYAAFVWHSFRRQNITVRTINVGGGLPGSLSPSAIARYASALGRSLSVGRVPNFVCIQCEPGRAVVENAGALCVSVGDVSVRQEEVFVLVDGGSNLVMPLWMRDDERRVRYLRMTTPSRSVSAREKVTLVGPLCAEGDRLGYLSSQAGVSVGDLLLIMDCGAYDWSTRYSFGLRMPRSYMVGSGRKPVVVMM